MDLISAACDRVIGSAAACDGPVDVCDVEKPHRMNESARLSDCDRAVLLTITYADLFDFPLTAEEVYVRLIRGGFDRRSVADSLDTLLSEYLGRRRDLYFIRGRENLPLRREMCAQRASRLWQAGRRYGVWLSRVPFVRMVAISGSLAVNNADEKADIDLFCITAAKRLWIARLFIVPLSKITRRLPRLFPYYLCVNYVLSEAALEVEEHNLFTAHEVLQAVPLFGGAVRREFLRRNQWATGLLPNLLSPPPVRSLGRDGKRRHRVKLLYELRPGARLGDALNRLIYRAFVSFYRYRARRRGWIWERIAAAYQLERYTVPEGGYASVVARLFQDRMSAIAGMTVTAEAVDGLFPADQLDGPAYHDWDRLFHEAYGDTRSEDA